MKKKNIFIIYFMAMLLLTSCSSLSLSPNAYFGPSLTLVSSGSIPKAAIQYSTNDFVFKKTGKKTIEYVEKVIKSIELHTTSN
jgi:hypothetical protein